MCTRKGYPYEEKYKTTKSIDFVNFKVQRSLQFMIMLAFILRVTALIQEIFNVLLINCYN